MSAHALGLQQAFGGHSGAPRRRGIICCEASLPTKSSSLGVYPQPALPPLRRTDVLFEIITHIALDVDMLVAPYEVVSTRA